jgi:hypothetical protein
MLKTIYARSARAASREPRSSKCLILVGVKRFVLSLRCLSGSASSRKIRNYLTVADGDRMGVAKR